ncbi:MAG: hypothetical protein FWF26_04985 [Treponema sp.]|nr:hypothetical protein [Treponema sp.]
MIIEQTIEIPADYRILLELPHSIPTGVKAKVEISIPGFDIETQSENTLAQAEIDNVRHLLKKEMTEKGTMTVIAESGDGWEAHVREHYAEP